MRILSRLKRVNIKLTNIQESVFVVIALILIRGFTFLTNNSGNTVISIGEKLEFLQIAKKIQAILGYLGGIGYAKNAPPKLQWSDIVKKKKTVTINDEPDEVFVEPRCPSKVKDKKSLI